MAAPQYTDALAVNAFSELPLKGTNGQVAIVMTATDTQSYIFSMAVYDLTGKGWVPSQKSQIKMSTVEVNGKVAGPVKIYTMEDVPFGFYPQQLMQLASAMQSVTIPPTISVGTNSPSYNNIKTGSVLTTVLNSVSSGVSASTAVDSPILPIPGNTDVYANVTGVALATTYKVKFAIPGFYVS